MANTQKSESHWPLTITGGFVSMFNLILPLILVRILSPSEIGTYKIFFLYVSLVPRLFLTAGITNGLSHWAGYEEKRMACLRSSWTLLFSIGLALLLAGILFENKISTLFHWSSVQSQLFIFGAFFTVIASFFEDANIAIGHIWRGAWFNSSFELLRNSIILISAFYFRNVNSVFWSYFLLMALKAILGISWGYIQGFQRISLEKKSFQDILGYAFPVSLSAVLTIATNYFDQIILSQKISPSNYAIYSFGCLTIPPLLIFEQSVNRVLIPKMSFLFSKQKANSAKTLFNDAISEMSWLLFPSAAGLIIFAEPIIKLMFTETYIEAAFYLRIFALEYIFIVFPFDSVARARGQGKWILRHLSIFSVISIILILWGIRIYGATGALLGMISSLALMRLVAMWLVHRAEKWELSAMFPWHDWARYLLFIGLGTIAAYAIKPILGNSLSWFICGGTIFSIIYLVGTISVFLKRRAELTEKTNILFLTQYLGLGGLERMILNLSRELKNDDRFNPIVFVYDNDPKNIPTTLTNEFIKSEIPVIESHKSEGISFKTAAKISFTILKHKCLIIHSHDLGALIYGVMAKWFTLGSVRLVHTQHSFVHLEKNTKYKYYEKFFTAFADEVTTVSEKLKEQYKSVAVDPKRIRVIPNGVQFPELPVLNFSSRIKKRQELMQALKNRIDSSTLEKLEQNIEKVWVLSMARIHPKKGQEHVLALWDKITEETAASAQLIFVGAETYPGQLDKLREQMKKINNSSSVVYAGYTFTPIEWLESADIYSSGSEFEGMPLGPLEAYGSGISTLVSNIPGHSMLPEFVKKFDLENNNDGVIALEEFINKSKNQFEATQSTNWKNGEIARNSLGTSAMADQYKKIYLGK